MVNYIDRQIGNYHIQQLLECGGFAEVYLASHIYIKERQVAIKILRASIDSKNLEQFRREAEIIEKLNTGISSIW